MNTERTSPHNESPCLHLVEVSSEDWNATPESIANGPACPSPDFYRQGYRNLLMGRSFAASPTAYGDIPEVAWDNATATRCQELTDTNGHTPVTGLSISDSSCADLGFAEGLNYELIPAEQIQAQWNQVLEDSNKQTAQQNQFQARQAAKEKMKKLERLLTMALNGGNLDMAMLLFSALETSQANDIAGNLLNHMKELQAQRSQLGDRVATLGQDQAQEAQKLNNQSSDLNTEIQFLQTFLQDVMSHKAEAQQMSSNYIKSRHDTAMGIIRNM